MKPFNSIVAIIFAITFTACSGGGGGATDLPTEMAAQKAIKEVILLYKQGKTDEALKRMDLINSKYGHTASYAESKAKFMHMGLAGSVDDAGFSLTAISLIKLQNAVIAFRRQTGKWPAPGQIKKPLDAWGRECYWVVGNAKQSFDILIVSGGPDMIPGTGDEVIVVWTQDDVGGYTDKTTGKKIGKVKKKRRPVKGKEVNEGHASQAMSVADMMKQDKEAGYEEHETISLNSLESIGNQSLKAGQPRSGEMVLTLDEIAGQL